LVVWKICVPLDIIKKQRMNNNHLLLESIELNMEVYSNNPELIDWNVDGSSFIAIILLRGLEWKFIGSIEESKEDGVIGEGDSVESECADILVDRIYCGDAIMYFIPKELRQFFQDKVAVMLANDLIGFDNNKVKYDLV
jgi:hypothetical protein